MAVVCVAFGELLFTLFGDFNFATSESMLINASHTKVRVAFGILLGFFTWRHIIIFWTAAGVRCCSGENSNSIEATKTKKQKQHLKCSTTISRVEQFTGTVRIGGRCWQTSTAVTACLFQSARFRFLFFWWKEERTYKHPYALENVPNCWGLQTNATNIKLYQKDEIK